VCRGKGSERSNLNGNGKIGKGEREKARRGKHILLLRFMCRFMTKGSIKCDFQMNCSSHSRQNSSELLKRIGIVEEKFG
jgi:hypothetical protein